MIRFPGINELEKARRTPSFSDVFISPSPTRNTPFRQQVDFSRGPPPRQGQSPAGSLDFDDDGLFFFFKTLSFWVTQLPYVLWKTTQRTTDTLIVALLTTTRLDAPAMDIPPRGCEWAVVESWAKAAQDVLVANEDTRPSVSLFGMRVFVEAI